MTATNSQTAQSAQSASRSLVPVALGAIVMTAAVMIWAYLIDSPWKSSPEATAWGFRGIEVGELAFAVGCIALGALVVFGVVVRHAVASAGPARCARDGLILGIVAAALAAPVFWSGVPILAGVGAAFLGVEANRRAGRRTAKAMVAIVLGVLAAVASTVFCIIG